MNKSIEVDKIKETDSNWFSQDIPSFIGFKELCPSVKQISVRDANCLRNLPRLLGYFRKCLQMYWLSPPAGKHSYWGHQPVTNRKEQEEGWKKCRLVITASGQRLLRVRNSYVKKPVTEHHPSFDFAVSISNIRVSWVTLFVVTSKLTVLLYLAQQVKHFFFYLLPTTNVKCPSFWFLKSGIPTLGAVLIITIRPNLIPQLSQCDLQVESKFSRIRWMTPVQCPVSQLSQLTLTNSLSSCWRKSWNVK